MLDIEKNILNTLDELSEQTKGVIHILNNNQQAENDLTGSLDKAQENLDRRKALLDQFEEQSQQLRELDEADAKQLEAASDFQQKYEHLMELDATMQDAIDEHLKRVQEQTRTNEKERNVNQKYADQRDGSVDNSLFITSKLEG